MSQIRCTRPVQRGSLYVVSQIRCTRPVQRGSLYPAAVHLLSTQRSACWSVDTPGAREEAVNTVPVNRFDARLSELAITIRSGTELQPWTVRENNASVKVSQSK